MIKKVAFIGHRVQDMARAKKFYGELLGLEKTAEYEGKWCEFDTPEGKTIALDTFSPDGTPPYMALETDDIEAEVVRLEQLGAKRIEFIKRWWVMEAPTGQRFCVVRPQHPRFAALARAWPA